MRFRYFAFFAAACLFSAAAAAQVPSNDEIRKILAERVGPENRGISIVVGVIDSSGRRVVGYGSLSKSDPRRPDGNTVYEIGSMSKVFTSLLLMDMARKGEVALTDPVSKFLPASVKMPERNGRNITLADLSTQSSGLPRMPDNFHPKDMENPYADYSVQQMYDFLSSYQLTRDAGSQYEYSNLGVGLLGHVLSLRAGSSWEALVRSRICEPLGMADTRVTLTPEMKARLAMGHNEALTQVSNWDIPTLAGAGALRSTANDMLTFLAANLGYVKSPLAQDMSDQISIRRPTGTPGLEIAYAWHVLSKDGDSIIWHNGGTGGYRTFMGFDPKSRAGVVVLSNWSTPAGPDDIGRHLLNASYPLLKTAPPTERKEITLDPAIFDRYVGSYQLAPWTLLNFSRDGSRFFAEITGQPKFEIFAESERKFFLKVVNAQLTFDLDSKGAVTQVTMHQGGDNAAPRLSEAQTRSALEQIEAHKTDVAKRFKEQTQSPGTEAAVRRWIDEIRGGSPDYTRMSPQFAELTRQQLPQLKNLVERYGAVQSVTFKGVGPGGADIYEAKFEHASIELRVVLGPDGKTQSLGLRPL